MFSPANLISFAQESALEVRGVKIPDFSDEKIHSQFESIISENPGISYYSYFELNIYNMLYYACDVTREYYEENRLGPPVTKVIPLKVLIAEIIMFLNYAKNFYRKSGFDGMLKLIARLENIKGRKMRREGKEDMDCFISYLDNALETEHSMSALSLIDDKGITLSTFKELCFSIGLKKIYSYNKEEMERFYEDGMRYLNWLE
jgi:hypothetical protein